MSAPDVNARADATRVGSAARVTLNVDAGESPDEPEELYAIADVLNIACGGHAGDDASMRRVLDACARHGTSAAAHPSFVDREGFGRRALTVPREELAAQIAEQCGRLARLASTAAGGAGVRVAMMKPHGALYHAADGDLELARAVVEGAMAALGRELVVVGPAGGALFAAASAAGASYAREGFADRGVLPSGKLVPRGQPGALVTEPKVAAARARELVAGGTVETICVHGDTPGAVVIARAVREALERQPRRHVIELRALGDTALRARLPERASPRAAQDALRACDGVVDVVVTETFACVYFEAARRPRDEDIEAALACAVRESSAATAARLHIVRVRYDGEDLGEVAARAGISPRDVARIHSTTAYSVKSLGFLPGFAYLGDNDPRLVVPRRAAPRPRVAANSVAVAASYTGIYPFASPGGWSLIGVALETRPSGGPFVAFDPARGALFELGDQIQFEEAT